MNLNSLLMEVGVDVNGASVLVMRHRPTEPELRKVLPRLAAEKPALFNAYQRIQNPGAELKLSRANYLASFVGLKSEEAVFVGLFSVAGYRRITYEQYWSKKANRDLKQLGHKGWVANSNRQAANWFDLRITDTLSNWKGKLILEWKAERAWARWANRNSFPVKAILEESVFDERMPRWDEVRLSWAELFQLPKSWIERLKEMRGVYLIFDSSAGKSYVGSASGADNIYGRWENYLVRGDGGNKLLRGRNPERFLFTILQLVAPETDREDVVRLESSWKERLHTRHPRFGLNAN